MDDKTVSERTHDGNMKVMILERDEGHGSRFAIEYGNKWITWGTLKRHTRRRRTRRPLRTSPWI
jgi:hypothetical protein